MRLPFDENRAGTWGRPTGDSRDKNPPHSQEGTTMLHHVMRRRIAIGILVAVLVALVTGTGITSAAGDPILPQGYPTEIDARPNTQTISSSVPPFCPATASWTVYFSGGTGTYNVHVSYGDGAGRSWSSYAGSSLSDSHTYGGCTPTVFTQSWQASSGGTTGYDTTWVDYN